MSFFLHMLFIEEQEFTIDPQLQLLWTTPETASFRRYLEFISQEL